MLEEAAVTCPYCWETIVLALDLTAGSARYSEDCPVCCQPLAVTLTVDPLSGEHAVQVEAENG